MYLHSIVFICNIYMHFFLHVHTYFTVLPFNVINIFYMVKCTLSNVQMHIKRNYVHP